MMTEYTAPHPISTTLQAEMPSTYPVSTCQVESIWHDGIMYEHPIFVTNAIYHVFNRGVAKQPLFHDERDYRQFLICLSFYLEASPTEKLSAAKQGHRLDEALAKPVDRPLVEILAYCLMPNHFHLVVRQLQDGGLSTFMRRALNSYTRYYNTRYRRVGTMFQGTFRAVLLESDEQLLHVTRYVHLNAPVAKLVDDPKLYPWSSYLIYLDSRSTRLCDPAMVLEMAGSPAMYESFVKDYLGYAHELALIKDLLIDID